MALNSEDPRYWRGSFLTRESYMAKGYLIDEAQQCIVFAMPGARTIIRCAISFATLAECFGAPQRSAVETFLENRTDIERIAAELIAAGLPSDDGGWIWVGGSPLRGDSKGRDSEAR